MRGLLLRLSALDADAATTVRVISFFDALVEGHATPEALVRATSGLAECGCGMQFGEDRPWRFAPSGAELVGGADHVSGRAEFAVENVIGSIWLERPDAVAPLDGLVLERASLAARILLSEQRQTRRVAALADPALMEVVLSRHEALADRSRALRHLGLVPEQPLRVVAARMDAACDPVVDAVALIALHNQRARHMLVSSADSRSF